MAEATIAMGIHGGDFLALAAAGAGSDAATIGAAPRGAAIAAALGGAAANGSGTTDGAGLASAACGTSEWTSSGASWIFSAVARREFIGTTLLRPAGGDGGIEAAGGRGVRRDGAPPGLLGRIARAGGGRLDRTGRGAGAPPSPSAPP